MPGAPSVLKLTLVLGCLSAFGPLSIDMYLPAFPHITRDLRAPDGAVEFTLAAFLLGTAAGQLVYGPLADRFGRRRPLLAGCGIYALGALICALASSMGLFTAARVVQALGGAAGMVIARAVVRDLFDEREAARMFSQLMLVMGVTPVLAPWLGGQILAFANWRMIFYLLTGFGLFCLLMSARFLPETLPDARRARGGLPATLRDFGRLLRDRRFLGYTLVAGFGAGTLFAYIAGSPYVFIQLHHVSEQRFGLFFGLNAAGFIGAAQFNRWLLHRCSPEAILPAATGGGLVAGLLLALCGATGWGGLPAFAALLFACLSMLGVAGPNIAAAALAPFGRAAGSASALLGTAQFLLGALAGGFVGLFHNGTAFPMSATVAAASAGGYLALRTLARPRPAG